MRKARLLLTFPAVVTTVVPAAMDANHTHLLNQQWPAHARFHGASYVAANVALGAVALWLLWAKRGTVDEALRLRIAALLPAVLWGVMVPALFSPHASSWPDGLPQVPGLPVAPNVFIALILCAVCATGAWMTRRKAC